MGVSRVKLFGKLFLVAFVKPATIKCFLFFPATLPHFVDINWCGIPALFRAWLR